MIDAVIEHRRKLPGVGIKWGKCRCARADSRSRQSRTASRWFNGACRLFTVTASPRSRSDGRHGGEESRRSQVLPTDRGGGAELVQVNVDHHQQQRLRCHQVPGGASRGGGGAAGAGGRKRHRELRGRGTLVGRQRDGGRHDDRRAAPGRQTQDRRASGPPGDHAERPAQLVVEPADSRAGRRHRHAAVPNLHRGERVTSSEGSGDVINRHSGQPRRGLAAESSGRRRLSGLITCRLTDQSHGIMLMKLARLLNLLQHS